MNREETNIFLEEEESELSSLSNLEQQMDQIYLPQNRKELLSILIRSELELAYIYATDIVSYTHVLKKIIRKPLKSQKKACKTRKTSYTSETSNNDFPPSLKSAYSAENT